MGIDYGDVRTGVAVCDKTEMLASPVCVVKESYRPKLVIKLAQLAAERKAELLVIGLPKNMDGSLGYRAQACTELADELSKATGLKCVMWDERLTTVSAYTELNAANKRGEARKSKVDEVAAVIILQSYIDSGSRKNERNV